MPVNSAGHVAAIGRHQASRSPGHSPAVQQAALGRLAESQTHKPLQANSALGLFYGGLLLSSVSGINTSSARLSRASMQAGPPSCGLVAPLTASALPEAIDSVSKQASFLVVDALLHNDLKYGDRGHVDKHNEQRDAPPTLPRNGVCGTGQRSRASLTQPRANHFFTLPLAAATDAEAMTEASAERLDGSYLWDGENRPGTRKTEVCKYPLCP